jgi:PAS domain S-box-containing protein
MSSSIRKMLWIAFAVLAVIVVAALAASIAVLQMEARFESRLVRTSEPLVDAVYAMDKAMLTMTSASRAFLLTQQTQYLQSYDDAVRDFEKAVSTATQLAEDPRDAQLVANFRRHFSEVKGLTDQEIQLVKEGRGANALEFMLESSRVRRAAPDYAMLLSEKQRRAEVAEHERMTEIRQWLMLSSVVLSILIIGLAAFGVWRIEQAVRASIAKEVRRTETMIAGMPDGVMLLDGEGRTVFINPAGQKLLGRFELDVPITRQPEVYGMYSLSRRMLDPKEVPAAQALATGRPVHDATMLLMHDDKEVAVSVNATPLLEDGKVAGAIVTFRDVTERRRLEEQLQAQADQAQTLADAGALFSSAIDPVWVTQAIAERTAEVLGDWAAVILKSSDNELRVAALYHRDMSSLGLAWSYIYRQPLVVGDGIIGQVVATGYPSLTTNVGTFGSSTEADTTSYHAPSMNLSSMLILPLRTRREMLGALVIAANDPSRAMSDEKLPLAEMLAERASLAIENSKLYTEQVEARRKVEDLSRLKDEFLSIASHELRTPVTSIKGYTQLAKTLIRENDLATSEEYLEIALDQIDRMSRLILELLDVSRIETGRLEIRREPIRWTGFVRDVVNRHHTAVSDRRFHLDVQEDSRIVYGDRDRLEQVLGNLLENAVKYSPDGSEIIVNVVERDDHFVTSVCDQGIGIPPDELNQVFERFHRGRKVSSTNYGGLGLGLYITKQIIERHGGAIWVESKEGSGTTFYFSLPNEQPARPEVTTSETPAAAEA